MTGRRLLWHKGFLNANSFRTRGVGNVFFVDCGGVTHNFSGVWAGCSLHHSHALFDLQTIADCGTASVYVGGAADAHPGASTQGDPAHSVADGARLPPAYTCDNGQIPPSLVERRRRYQSEPQTYSAAVSRLRRAVGRAHLVAEARATLRPHPRPAAALDRGDGALPRAFRRPAGNHLPQLPVRAVLNAAASIHRYGRRQRPGIWLCTYCVWQLGSAGAVRHWGHDVRAHLPENPLSGARILGARVIWRLYFYPRPWAVFLSRRDPSRALSACF